MYRTSSKPPPEVEYRHSRFKRLGRTGLRLWLWATEGRRWANCHKCRARRRKKHMIDHIVGCEEARVLTCESFFCRSGVGSLAAWRWKNGGPGGGLIR